MARKRGCTSWDVMPAPLVLVLNSSVVSCTPEGVLSLGAPSSSPLASTAVQGSTPSLTESWSWIKGLGRSSVGLPMWLSWLPRGPAASPCLSLLLLLAVSFLALCPALSRSFSSLLGRPRFEECV